MCSCSFIGYICGCYTVGYMCGICTVRVCEATPSCWESIYNGGYCMWNSELGGGCCSVPLSGWWSGYYEGVQYSRTEVGNKATVV